MKNSTNSDIKFGIIGAMDVEIEHLCSLMKNKQETEISHLKFFEGKINDKSCVVVQSGIGKVNAALCAQLLIIKFDVTHIINTGIAGAMAKELKPLDIVVSTDCVYHDADTTFFGDAPCTIPGMPTFFKAEENLITLAEKSFVSENNSTLYKGRVASGDVFVCDKSVKEKIMQNCNPFCVEMEGTAIAHACYLHKIPFVIIRCISDSADESVENEYSFNREVAAKISGQTVTNMLKNF
jgi:adenosylhomocysteine nucleosidase